MLNAKNFTIFDENALTYPIVGDLGLGDQYWPTKLKLEIGLSSQD